MKKKTMLLLMTLLGLSCSNLKTPITILHGFFLNNTVILNTDISTFTIKNQEDMTSRLGVASTMDFTPEIVDFSTYNVGVIATTSDGYNRLITIEKTFDKKGVLYVDYKIVQGRAQTFETKPLLVFKYETAFSKVIFNKVD